MFRSDSVVASSVRVPYLVLDFSKKAGVSISSAAKRPGLILD
jgi:hypothetical protein